jgi:polysaccharide biosynthesis/export protein
MSVYLTLIVCAVLGFAAPLISGDEIAAPKQTTAARPAGPAPDAPPTETRWASRYPRYQLRPGDTMDLLFSPTEEFNQSVAVQPDGFVTLREIGDVYVRDKTVPEITALLVERYSQILHEPVISVVLKDFEKPHFTVGGQVGRPGKYELRADTTASEAISIAGGLTERAKHTQIVVFRRVSNDWAEVKILNLKELYKGNPMEDLHLRAGDALFVPQNTLSKIKPFIPVWSISSFLGMSPWGR